MGPGKRGDTKDEGGGGAMNQLEHLDSRWFRWRRTSVNFFLQYGQANQQVCCWLRSLLPLIVRGREGRNWDGGSLWPT